jgi:hypothetical protein
VEAGSRAPHHNHPEMEDSILWAHNQLSMKKGEREIEMQLRMESEGEIEMQLSMDK